MRRPPSKEGQAPRTEIDISSSNSTLNAFLGGRKSWQIGASAVRATPRAPGVNTAVTTGQKSMAALLPSPAPSASPVLTNVPMTTKHTTNALWAEDRREIYAGEVVHPCDISSNPPQRRGTSSSRQLKGARSSDIPYIPESPSAPVQQQYAEPQSSSNTTQQPRDTASMNELPPLPDSVLLSSDERSAGVELGQLSPTIISPEVQEQNRAALTPGSTSVQSALESPGTTGLGIHQWENSHGQLPSPIQTNDSSPRTISDVPLPSTLLSLESPDQTPRSYPSRPHKRQRTQPPVAMTLQQKLTTIDLHIASVGGHGNLGSLEVPRYSMLQEACRTEDVFYVALHQVFCAWDHDKNEVIGLNAYPEEQTLQQAFGILGQLIRFNHDLAHNHLVWFAHFPWPLSEPNSMPEYYKEQLRSVGSFLGGLPTKWLSLEKACRTRHYPPLCEELVNGMGLLSGQMQSVVFRAARRNLGVKNERIGQAMDNVFQRDQDYFRNYLMNSHMAGLPVSLSMVEQHKKSLVSQYMALYNMNTRESHPSMSSTNTTGHASPPVLANNTGPRRGSTVNAFPQTQQGPGQTWPAIRNTTGNMQHGTQQSQMVSRTNSLPNVINVASRPTSAASHRVHSNTSSPTMLQGLAMQSPTINGSHFNQTLRSNGGSFLSSMNSQGSVHQNPMLISNLQSQQQTYPIQNMQQQAFPQVLQQAQVHPQNRIQQLALQHHQQQQVEPHSGAHQIQQQQQERIYQQQQQLQMQQTHLAQRSQQPFQQQPQYHQRQQMSQVPSNNQDPSMRRGSFNPQQGVHSRNSSISNTGCVPPNTAHGAVISPSIGVRPAPTRAHSLVNNQLQYDVQAYAQKPWSQKSLVPPMGYNHGRHAGSANITALHQAHLRSPRLIPYTIPSTMAHDDTSRKYYQAIRDLALLPSRISTDLPLSKFQFTVSDEDFAMIPRDEHHNDGSEATRTIKQGALQYRIRCVQLGRDTSLCPVEEWVVKNNVWPQNASISINDQQLQLRRKDSHGKDLPLDITQFVKSSTNQITMSIMWAATRRDRPCYYLAVEVVEILQHGQILDLCQKNRLPSHCTLNKIKKSLAPANDDDEIAMVTSDLSIELTDPFTAKIYEIPVRGSGCLHRECFDLETFLLTRPSKPRCTEQVCQVDCWKCPLCSRDARPSRLQIDDFMAEIRAGLQQQGKLDVKAILIDADGNWRPKVEARKGDHDGDTSEHDDDEIDRNKSVPTDNTNGGSRVIEIVDLDSD